MRIVCRHGHYAFYPRNESEIFRFCKLYTLELVRENDYYTFPFLKGLKDFSLRALPYKNLPALKTYEGQPWEVMKENGFVYSIALKMFVPKLAIITLIDPQRTEYFWINKNPMIQAGSINASGQRVLSFDAEYFFDVNKLRLMGFDYE